MEIERPFGPDAPTPPVTCPSPQPDGARVVGNVCIRQALPESQVAAALKQTMPPCDELGYCARAYVAALLNAQAESEQSPEPGRPRQTW